jgi:hypothetical protein
MTIDATQMKELFPFVVVLGQFLIIWALINALGRQYAQQPPTVSPGPPPVVPPIVPPQPPVVQPPAVVPPVVPPVVNVPPVVGPRFHVVSTSFAGPHDSVSSSTSAYDEHVIHGATELAAALPYHFPGKPPIIRVFANNKSVDVPIADVGPWYPSDKGPADPYWQTGSRPRAETDSRTNHSALDLTPAVYAALGYTGNLEAITTQVSWDFVSELGGPATVQVPTTTGLQPNTWPTQAQAPAFYGSEASIPSQLVKVVCPWLLNGNTHTIEIHTKCAASLDRILNYIWVQCGKSQAQIDAFGYNVFDGSYNDRPIAGTATLSMHAYGCAMDWNAAANPQHAPLSQTKFKEDSLIVTAFKAEGWIWGGDWSPASIDAMHFQAARVR